MGLQASSKEQWALFEGCLIFASLSGALSSLKMAINWPLKGKMLHLTWSIASVSFGFTS